MEPVGRMGIVAKQYSATCNKVRDFWARGVRARGDGATGFHTRALRQRGLTRARRSAGVLKAALFSSASCRFFPSLPPLTRRLACRIGLPHSSWKIHSAISSAPPATGPFPLRHAQTDRRPPRRPAEDPAGREEPEAQARRRHPVQPALPPLKHHAQVVAHDGRRERRFRASERERVRHDVRRKLRQERHLCRTMSQRNPKAPEERHIHLPR